MREELLVEREPHAVMQEERKSEGLYLLKRVLGTNCMSINPHYHLLKRLSLLIHLQHVVTVSLYLYHLFFVIMME